MENENAQEINTKVPEVITNNQDVSTLSNDNSINDVGNNGRKNDTLTIELLYPPDDNKIVYVMHENIVCEAIVKIITTQTTSAMALPFSRVKYTLLVNETNTTKYKGLSVSDKVKPFPFSRVVEYDEDEIFSSKEELVKSLLK